MSLLLFAGGAGVEGDFAINGNAVGLQVTAVPEPGAAGLLISGALLLCGARRRSAGAVADCFS